MPSPMTWGSPGPVRSGLRDWGWLGWGWLDWAGLVFGPGRPSIWSTASVTAEGARLQWPCRSSPSSAAKQAGESKRGTHSQSTEPSRLIRAADRMSPMSA